MQRGVRLSILRRRWVSKIFYKYSESSTTCETLFLRRVIEMSRLSFIISWKYDISWISVSIDTISQIFVFTKIVQAKPLHLRENFRENHQTVSDFGKILVKII
jgi:hypothetical protein